MKTAATTLFVTLLVLAAGAGPATAQWGTPGGMPDPVHVEVSGPEGTVGAGDAFDVLVRMRIDEPYHVYAADSPGEFLIRTDVGPGESGLPDGVDFVRSVYPTESKSLTIESLGETYAVWEGEFEIRARFEVDGAAAPGERELEVQVEYQACNDEGCLLPQAPAFSVPLEIAAAGTGTAVAPPPLAPEPTGGGEGAADGASLDEQIQQALVSGDVWLFLGLAVLAGFVSLLTPCVFPMIPITVSFFAKRAEKEGGRGARYALAYGGGIIATYTGFGMAMALAFGAGSVQNFATNPWVNLGVAALFVFFGLSLLGFYDLKPPEFLARRAQAAGTGGRPGYLPVMAMGFVFTITAFTCTVPIVGALLAQLATTASPGLMVAGMLAYSAAFALPFVLLALFPSALSSLPGAGGWMVTVKVMLGFVELIAALKFLSNADLAWQLELLPRPTMLLLSVLLLGAMMLYLFGTYTLPHDVGGRKSRSLRFAGGLGVLFVAVYLSWGMTGRVLHPWLESYVPPRWYAADEGAHEDPIPWREDHAAALAEARELRRNVFIDFTGIMCVNCRAVETAVFDKPAFVEAMDAFVPVRLYTDRKGQYRENDESNQRLMQEVYRSSTLPLYVILDPDGNVLRYTGYTHELLEVDNFLDFLFGDEVGRGADTSSPLGSER